MDLIIGNCLPGSLKDPNNQFRMHWDARSIDLGSYDWIDGKVLVGLGFSVNEQNRLELKGRFHSFDEKTGKIDDEDSLEAATQPENPR